MQCFQGKSVYKGIVMGPVAVLKKNDYQVKRARIEDPEAEVKRVEEAVEVSKKQLGRLYDKAVREVGEASAAIFEVHQMMLEDEDYLESMENMIRTELVNAEYAAAATGDNFAEMFAAMDDEYMKARSAVAIIMTMVLPHTGTAVLEDGSTVSYTYSWVVNFQQVKDASWFALPGIAGFGKLAEVKPVFRVEAILPVAIMFIVTTVETVGDICACVESGMDREATDSELSGGIICDGLGSSFAAALGVLPNTSFAQNVGIISMTKIVNRMALSCGAIFLILCGLCPKIAAFVSIMPQSVLGGAAVMMFASILVSGIQLITKEPITSREITIVSVALGLGYGLGSTAGATSELPYYIQLIFGGSGIVPAAVAAIVLNIIIPKEKKKAE